MKTNFALPVTNSFKLQRDSFGQLQFIDADGRIQTGVIPVRAFPIAAPDEGISLVDTESRELVWIDRLDSLPITMRNLLEEELAQREFAPYITRLVGVSTFGTPSVWTIETDRGATTLVLKGEEDIRRLGGGALLIAGSEGVQYRVRDMAALDRASRRLLERFL